MFSLKQIQKITENILNGEHGLYTIRPYFVKKV